MKTILSTNRSGKFTPPIIPNPRKGPIVQDTAVYPGYVVLLDESRLVMNADEFLARGSDRLIVGLFVISVGDPHPNTCRTSYIGRIQSISDEFLVDSIPEPVRTITFAPVCRTAMGPYHGVFDLESLVSCNVRVLDMQACYARQMIFRPSYDMAVPKIVIAGSGVAASNITFGASFDVPQTWEFSLQNGTDEGVPGTLRRSSSNYVEIFRASTVSTSKITVENSGQGDANVITPRLEMLTGTSKLRFMGTYVASFTSPVAGEISGSSQAVYWLAFCKLKDSMTFETRFVRHGDDANTAWSLGMSSSITILYSNSRADY